MYPGFVYWIEVRLWADTGEIIDVKPMGYGGGSLPIDMPNEPSVSPLPSSTTTQDLPNLALNAGIIAGVIITVAALTSATIVTLKKRRSNR